MNFLQLCQRVTQKCGISGASTLPSTTVAQVGELKRIVDWVNEAWVDIQNLQQGWDWMRSEFSFNTVANQQPYLPAVATDTVTAAPIAAFSNWRLESVRSYETALGVTNEQFMVYWPYDRFRNFYMYQQQPPGRPLIFTVRPRDKALLLGNTPDGIYTVRGEYQKDATEMAADIDVPSIPTEYHMLIVYGAMMKYAMFESAPEVYAGAEKDYKTMMFKLTVNQTGPLEFGLPLA